MISLDIPQSFNACVNFTQEVGGVRGSRYKTPWYKERKPPYELQKTDDHCKQCVLSLFTSFSLRWDAIYIPIIYYSFIPWSNFNGFFKWSLLLISIYWSPLGTYDRRAGRVLYSKCLTVNYTLYTFIVFS